VCVLESFFSLFSHRKLYIYFTTCSRKIVCSRKGSTCMKNVKSTDYRLSPYVVLRSRGCYSDVHMTAEDSSCDRTDGLREEAGRLLNNFFMHQIIFLTL